MEILKRKIHKKHCPLNYYIMHLIFLIISYHGSSVRHAFSTPVPLVCHFHLLYYE